MAGIMKQISQLSQPEEILALLKQTFHEQFGDGEAESFFSPGRVNLIGEHIDYNGGHVFPCALTIGTYGVARKNNLPVFRFGSLNFEHLGIIEIPADDLEHDPDHHWTNYPKGVIDILRKEGHEIQGFDMMIYGNIPNASGLSSSASVEVLTGVICRELFGLPVDNRQLALVGQRAENEFIGVNCGIMDQFAVAMGKRQHAILLDTSTLDYRYAPLKLDNVRIVIASSNKRRGLSGSKYNERRMECEEALRDLQNVVPIKYLCELVPEQFETYKDAINDPVALRRARHAVTEEDRTGRAFHALENGDLIAFGELMRESHESLRDDYEVTGVELDTLVEAAWNEPGCIGARMTGAGFGGCTVNLVHEQAIARFIEQVGRTYKEKIGYAADFYIVSAGPGAGTFAECFGREADA